MRINKRVWINGCFDVLHMGHIKLFQYAKYCEGATILQPNWVCVGIDKDERVSKLKGPNRPINNEKDRFEFLESIKYVDEVQFFNTDLELETKILYYKPDLMVIGSDYKGKEIIGSEFIPEIKYFDRYGGLSSSKIIGK